MKKVSSAGAKSARHFPTCPPRPRWCSASAQPSRKNPINAAGKFIARGTEPCPLAAPTAILEILPRILAFRIAGSHRGGRKLVAHMIERKLTLAEIFLIAGTRVALGAGIGLLLADRLSRDQRKA